MACKIHQLNSSWCEAKKQSYVKHAIREYNIHKGLRHAHITALADIFEIDNNTFATILELCDGEDLDSHLRDHGVGGCWQHCCDCVYLVGSIIIMISQKV